MCYYCNNMNKKEKLPEDCFEAVWTKDSILANDNDFVRDLYDKSRFGEPVEKKKFQYALVEALFLIERGKMRLVDAKDKEIDYDSLIKKASKIESNYWTKYCVFRDLRTRGYIVKTALKFGADFRVYDRGIKPGEDHAKWIVYPVSEGEGLTWYEFAAKNRVAHSTKKRLLIGIVDSEGEPTYYEIAWKRP